MKKFLLLLLAIGLLLLSCKKKDETISIDDICQANPPENNNLIDREVLFQADGGYGNIIDLKPSPSGNLFYLMYLSEKNNAPTDYHYVIVDPSGNSNFTIDTNLIKEAGSFRYEIGEMNTNGYRLKNAYLPDYFIPRIMLPIYEGVRKGQILISGYFLKFSKPYNYSAHIFLYNPQTKSFSDLYGADILETIGMQLNEVNQAYYEYYIESDSRIKMLQLSTYKDSISVDTVAVLNHSNGGLRLRKNPDGTDFLFGSGFGILNRYTISNKQLTETLPLYNCGSVSSEGIAVDDENIYLSGLLNEGERVVSASGYSYKYNPQNPSLITFPLHAKSQEDASYLYSIIIENEHCGKDDFSLVSQPQSVTYTFYDDDAAGIININSHVFSCGTFAAKDYYYDGEIQQQVGNAYIISYDKSTRLAKHFSFGGNTYASGFHCATVIGDYLYAGGYTQNSKSAWLVKVPLTNLK